MIPLPSRARQLAALYRVVARLDAAGIPPLQRAAALEEAPQGPHARAAAKAFVEAFTTGGLPSQSLAARRAVPRSHAEVLAAGEATGRVDSMLDLLASWCEEQARVQAMALRLLMEPAAAWLVIALIVPLGTLIRNGFGAYAARALPVLLVPLALGAVLRWHHRSSGRLPGFAEPLRLLAVARFCRTLALLNGAGLPLPRALRDAAEAAAHPDVTEAAHRAARAVEKGATLSDALRRTGVLRPVEMALVADGEITGRLDVAFARAAGLLEHEGFQKARWRLRIVGAVLFIMVVAYVAFTMAAAVGSTTRELGV